MKPRLVFGVLAALVTAPLVVGQSAEQLQQLLRRFPDADADRDGTLTIEEARAYYEAQRGRAAKGGGQKADAAAPAAPAPTHSNIKYGPHDRNVFDFWQAVAVKPAPVVIYIHGGGFISGDKNSIRRDSIVQQCLDAGVSFAAINYRYLSPSAPIQDVLRDCARAVQFIRANADEWNVDKTRVVAYGTSAGAGTSLWLAFHDDLADPKNADPVLRESSRLLCAGAISAQFSYDFLQWKEIFGAEAVQRFGARYDSPLLYGFLTKEELEGTAGQKVRADCDMRGLISNDDPPVFLSVSLPDVALTNSNQFLHHPKHTQLVLERCVEQGVAAVANIPALQIKPASGGPANWREFLFAQLNVKPAAAPKGSPAGAMNK